MLYRGVHKFTSKYKLEKEIKMDKQTECAGYEKRITMLLTKSAANTLELGREFLGYRKLFDTDTEFSHACNTNWGVKLAASSKYVEIGQHYDRLKKHLDVLPVGTHAIHILATCPPHYFAALVKEGVLRRGVSASVIMAALDVLAGKVIGAATPAAKPEEVSVVAHTRSKGAESIVQAETLAGQVSAFCATFTPVSDQEAWTIDGQLDAIIEAAQACQKRIKVRLVHSA